MKRVPARDEMPPEKSVAIIAIEDVTEEEASRQGAWAYTFGFQPDENPYAEYADESEWWDQGYWTAADNCEG